MRIASRRLLLLLSLSSAVGGPLTYLKPGLSGQKEGHEELLRQVEELRKADVAAKAGEPKVPDEPTPKAVPPAKLVMTAKGASRLAIGGFAKRLRLPVAAAAVGWAALLVQSELQASAARKAAASAAAAEEEAQAVAEAAAQLELEEATERVRQLVGPDPDPSPLPADTPSRVALAAELRERASVLEVLVPLYKQLSMELPLNLGSLPADELRARVGPMDERVGASGAVLREYEALGQAPPPNFRSWPTDVLRAREANMTAKAELLREVVQAQSRLGRTKMDWELPTCTHERLRELSQRLTAEAEKLAAHKEKQALLGKVEAALWLRREDPPIALHMMSTAQLRTLLDKLHGREPQQDAPDTPDDVSPNEPAAPKKPKAAS